MARQVLPIAGAIVGAYFGNPQLGYAIGSLIGNAVDPIEVEGNKIGDNQIQAAAEGGARAIVYGRGCIRATCVLDRGNRQVRRQRDRASKGGGPVTNNERVFWTFAIGLGEDLIGGAILRIWDGEKLVYDATPESTIPEETAEFAQKFRFYDGSETQLPDPALEAIHGIGNTPYHRGTAYVVFPNYDLTDNREALPNLRWEVASTVQTSTVPQWLAVHEPDSGILKSSPDGWDWSAPSINVPLVGGGQWTPQANAYMVFKDGVVAAVSSNIPVGGDTPFAARDVNGVWRRTDMTSIPAGSGRVAKSETTFFTFIPSNSYFNRASGDGITWADTARRSEHGVQVGGRMLTAWATNNPFGRVLIRTTNLEGSGSIFLPDYDAGHRVDNAFLLSDGALAVLALYDDNDDTVKLHTSFDAGNSFSYLSSPFPTSIPNYGTSMIVGVHSPQLGRWFIAAGNRIIHGTSGLAMGLDPLVFPGRIFGIGQDGQKVIVCGEGGFLYAWTPANGWEPLSSGVTENIMDVVALGEMETTTSVGLPIPLSSIVGDLHQRAGHNISQYNVTELTDMTAGIVFEQSTTYREAINTMVGPYMADPSDYDKAIHYIKRGKPVVRTLTEADLVDEPETSMRENAIEYPKKLHFFFQSPVTHYAATKATSTRSSPDVKVIGETSVAVPITFNNPDEPAQISAKLHKVYWMDAEGEITWHVTDEHIDLVPGDCVGLSYRGIVRRARITRIEDDPGVRKLVMRADRQSAYTSAVTGIPLPPPTPPQPSIVAPTALAVIDESAMVDAADDLHYIAALSGTSDVWTGAALQRSLDGGASFGTVSSASLNAIMGVLQAEVSAASEFFTDTTNVVRVQLYTDDELEGRSTEAWLSEQGAFALSWDDDGVRRWEFLQARDVDDLGEGVFELSHLMRGVLNTEAAEHPPGSLFVWLDGALLKIIAQSAWMGTTLTHRAVSNGLSPETAPHQTAPYVGRSQIEWPVAHVFAGLNGDDLEVAIVPRHRFGTDDSPIRSINWDGYRITASDGANTETVDTAIDGVTIDVTGWSTPISVSVSQLNRITGAGPSVTKEVT